jgi:hypothetical protein
MTELLLLGNRQSGSSRPFASLKNFRFKHMPEHKSSESIRGHQPDQSTSKYLDS